jgi:hypothetical protein
MKTRARQLRLPGPCSLAVLARRARSPCSLAVLAPGLDGFLAPGFLAAGFLAGGFPAGLPAGLTAWQEDRLAGRLPGVPAWCDR